jgi:hypothetical protein
MKFIRRWGLIEELENKRWKVSQEILNLTTTD